MIPKTIGFAAVVDDAKSVPLIVFGLNMSGKSVTIKRTMKLARSH